MCIFFLLLLINVRGGWIIMIINVWPLDLILLRLLRRFCKVIRLNFELLDVEKRIKMQCILCPIVRTTSNNTVLACAMETMMVIFQINRI